MSGLPSRLKSATAMYAELPPVANVAGLMKSGVCPNAAAAMAVKKLRVLRILGFISFPRSNSSECWFEVRQAHPSRGTRKRKCLQLEALARAGLHESVASGPM